MSRVLTVVGTAAIAGEAGEVGDVGDVGGVGVVEVGRVAVVVGAVAGCVAVEVPVRLVAVVPGVRAEAVSAINNGVAEDVDSALSAVVSGSL